MKQKQTTLRPSLIVGYVYNVHEPWATMYIYMSKQIHRPLCKRMWVGLIFEHFLKRGHESFGEACKLYLSIPE
jgi:hypothetical protein